MVEDGAVKPAMDPRSVRSILGKFGRDANGGGELSSVLTFKELYGRLSLSETQLIKDFLKTDPKSLGFKGPFVSLAEAPENLAEIGGQYYFEAGKRTAIPVQYLPPAAHKAFQKLAAAMKREIGRGIMIDSGYRSPACQTLVFLSWYERDNYDLHEVARGVALPGYSQHGDPLNTAIDVINIDGLPKSTEAQKFADTVEYGWLTKNAARFGYGLSYPEGNPWGIKFEPWHWRYDHG